MEYYIKNVKPKMKILLADDKSVDNKIIFNKIEEIINDDFLLKRNNSSESIYKNSCEDSRIMDQDTRVDTDIDKFEDGRISFDISGPRKESNKRISRVSFKILKSLEGNRLQKLIISEYVKFKIVTILLLKMKKLEKI